MERRLCKCGCNEIVKTPSSQFLTGHSYRLLKRVGKEEYGKIYINECKEIECACGCGGRFTPKRSDRIYIRGHNCRGKTHEELYGTEVANKMKVIARETVKKAQAGCFSTIEKKERWRQKLKATRNSSVCLSNRPENICAKILKNRGPNKPEKVLIDIISKANLPFEFVGNGSLIISGKNPDFASTDGSRKIVEFYGDFFHKDAEKNSRRESIFKQAGYEVLVVWEHELKSSWVDVENKLKLFAKNLQVAGTR